MWIKKRTRDDYGQACNLRLFFVFGALFTKWLYLHVISLTVTTDASNISDKSDRFSKDCALGNTSCPLFLDFLSCRKRVQTDMRIARSVWMMCFVFFSCWRKRVWRRDGENVGLPSGKADCPTNPRITPRLCWRKYTQNVVPHSLRVQIFSLHTHHWADCQREKCQSKGCKRVSFSWDCPRLYCLVHAHWHAIAIRLPC